MLNHLLQNPRVVGHDLLVIIFVQPYFFEAVFFIKLLGFSIGRLYMKIYFIDNGFCVRGCRVQNELESLGTKSSRTIRLSMKKSLNLRRHETTWDGHTASTPIVIRYNCT